MPALLYGGLAAPLLLLLCIGKLMIKN